MVEQKSRNNHYIPEWYQRRFLTEGQQKLVYLNLFPEEKLPDGRTIRYREISNFYPSQCFCEMDLYTTQFGNDINDEIEQYLMGSLDTNGATAVEAITNGDERDIHEAFEPFFEYLDAQKLRTIKGLDWIGTKYGRLSQLELMIEMQGLRTRHCTMWTEGVREIVSAIDSDVKFIISDHPVTIYNAAYSPDSDGCSYPEDPGIELIGSQTIFVLDENHCLILTNLEYAENPEGVDLTTRRTNSRFRGRSMVRTDAYIRSRKFNSEEVLAVNYLLKTRARKFIASSNKDWLYPETHFKGSWGSIAKTLLPKDGLYQFGGEIYVGHKDGSVHYQDAYGRTSGAHKYLQKKKKDINANDNCGCGSGKKFKKCCSERAMDKRPAWDVYSIRERNLMLIRAAKDILGLNKGKTWDDVRKELSDEQVAKIHDFYGGLWPKDTNIESLLPRPDPNISRGVFLATVDPRTIGANGIGMLNYFDEIILPSPFVNPNFIKPDFSPVHSPKQHKEQALKNLLFLFSIEAQIHAGLIHMVPDPTEFNELFRKDVWDMAEVRTKGWTPSDEDMEQVEHLSVDDLKRTIQRLPKPNLKAYIRQITPEIEEELLERVVDQMKLESENDPLALLQNLESGKENSQVRTIKSFNLETALFLACLTGSFVYTDLKLHWEHLHQHTKAQDSSNSVLEWKPILDAIRSKSFPIQHDSNEQIHDRFTSDSTGPIRRILSKILSIIANHQKPEIALAMTTALDGHLQLLRKNKAADWIFEAEFKISVPNEGFETNAIRRLVFTYGRTDDVKVPSFVIFTKFLNRH
ncbi:MAG: DUF4238 domain-containing protein [Pseudomonadota bacterium]